MKAHSSWPALFVIVTLGILAGCSRAAKSTGVAGTLPTALDQEELKRVSVSQNRDKGVVTLGGHIALDWEKAQGGIRREVHGEWAGGA